MPFADRGDRLGLIPPGMWGQRAEGLEQPLALGPRRPALGLHSRSSLARCPCTDVPPQLGSDSHSAAFLTPRLPRRSEALVLAGSASLKPSGLTGVRSSGGDAPRLPYHWMTSQALSTPGWAPLTLIPKPQDHLT